MSTWHDFTLEKKLPYVWKKDLNAADSRRCRNGTESEDPDHIFKYLGSNGLESEIMEIIPTKIIELMSMQ